MSDHTRFAATLARLMRRRRLDLSSLSQRAQVPEPELLAVTLGATPERSQLLRLATALGLQAADLFLVAEVPLLGDMLPRDRKAAIEVSELVYHAIHLSVDARALLRERARELPEDTDVSPPPPKPAREPGNGALLVEMLGNRNLDWHAAAQVLLLMSGLYLSPTTIGAVARGRKELTAELAAGFGLVLGISPDDMTALTEINVTGLAGNPAIANLAELIWDVRRLSAGQVKHLCEVTRSMRGDHGQ